MFIYCLFNGFHVVAIILLESFLMPVCRYFSKLKFSLLILVRSLLYFCIFLVDFLLI